LATEEQKLASPIICKIGDDSDFVTCELKPIKIETFEKMLSHCKAEILQSAYLAANGMPDEIAKQIRADANEESSSLHVADPRFIRWCMLRDSARELAVELSAKPVGVGRLTKDHIRKWLNLPEDTPEGKLRSEQAIQFYRNSGFYIPELGESEGESNEATNDESKKKELSNESDSANTLKSCVVQQEPSAAVDSVGQ
jgi:hypothetical protein